MRKTYIIYAKSSKKAIENTDIRFPGIDSSSIIICPHLLIPIMGHKSMLDLSILMNFQWKFCSSAEKENNGWFPCSVQNFNNAFPEFDLSPGRQTRLFNKLEKLNLVKRKLIGSPPIRHVWIDFDLLSKLCNKQNIKNE